MNRVRNYEGYDTKIFLKKVNLDLICTICSCIFNLIIKVLLGNLENVLFVDRLTAKIASNYGLKRIVHLC